MITVQLDKKKHNRKRFDCGVEACAGRGLQPNAIKLRTNY
jgi:hypothetical protein